ncbi:MAG: nucleotide pyrophosphohydrolase [Fusobacteria bacterium]|nr:nucleotide pyrophosphohydrolase [Fusobacteriota bacterium]
MIKDDKNTEIEVLKKRIREFVAARNWQEFHSPKNLAMSVAIEAAELMEIFQWKTPAEALDITKSSEFEHLREELADVMIYCISMANQLGIDIAAMIEDKVIKNGVKYPEPIK